MHAFYEIAGINLPTTSAAMTTASTLDEARAEFRRFRRDGARQIRVFEKRTCAPFTTRKLCDWVRGGDYAVAVEA